MRQHDIGLELLQLAHRNPGLRQPAEAGVDAIGRPARGDDALDGGEARAQGGKTGRIELERRALSRGFLPPGKGWTRAPPFYIRNISTGRSPAPGRGRAR